MIKKPLQVTQIRKRKNMCFENEKPSLLSGYCFKATLAIMFWCCGFQASFHFRSSSFVFSWSSGLCFLFYHSIFHSIFVKLKDLLVTDRPMNINRQRGNPSIVELLKILIQESSQSNSCVCKRQFPILLIFKRQDSRWFTDFNLTLPFAACT